MAQTIIRSSCKRHYDAVYNEKPQVTIKHVMIVEIREVVEKQAPLTPNNADNISTKSSAQQSQSSFFNTLEIITNNTNAILQY